jgi:hypothetical protein
MKLDHSALEHIKAECEWANDEFAATFLPHCRAAAVVSHLGDKELRELIADCVSGGVIPEMLKGFACTAEEFLRLAELVHGALERANAVLAATGYSPGQELPTGRLQ